ncbi:MAG: hypothetical protein P4L45_09890 [Ignavibacteriaceae bacterium]|nr:hypothetical protein [Ignavibacteriaceae bacterium]
MSQMHIYAKEFEFLYKTIQEHKKENKPCGEYVTQMTQVMTKMEKEDRVLAPHFIDTIKDKVNKELESE